MYFKIRGSVPILVYELVRCPVRFGMSPETLSIFIYPTGRFYHTLRYFRTVFSVSACDLPQDAEENTQKQPVMKTIYFFDDRQQPKVPGQPSAADYKKEKRLWNKPKRYTPEEYYGMQGSSETSTEDTSNSYGYDY